MWDLQHIFSCQILDILIVGLDICEWSNRGLIEGDTISPTNLAIIVRIDSNTILQSERKPNSTSQLVYKLRFTLICIL